MIAANLGLGPTRSWYDAQALEAFADVLLLMNGTLPEMPLRDARRHVRLLAGHATHGRPDMPPGGHATRRVQTDALKPLVFQDTMPGVPEAQRCNLCQNPDTLTGDCETGTVHSNVREFRDESFTVWRCRGCRSIHARDGVDLPRYYARYPFQRQKRDLILRLIHRNVLRRLKRAGLKPAHKILDYGCGSGHLVRTLRAKGYAESRGYDAYGTEFRDKALLDDQYDLVHCQDVVEHVDDPIDLLRSFDRMMKPGGTVVIGTPNADAIDLSRPADFIHALHQPYHIHIFSRQALLEAGRAVGWTLERYYPTQYTNTLIPCLNLRFGLEYGRCFDDTIDLAFDGFRPSYRLLSPRVAFLALAGYFFCPETDVMAVFRKPHR